MLTSKILAIKDKFHILFIDNLLDELHKTKFFAKLDLYSSYLQIHIKKDDISKMAFQTYEDHYEFHVMLFDLTNTVSTFQS